MVRISRGSHEGFFSEPPHHGNGPVEESGDDPRGTRSHARPDTPACDGVRMRMPCEKVTRSSQGISHLTTHRQIHGVLRDERREPTAGPVLRAHGEILTGAPRRQVLGRRDDGRAGRSDVALSLHPFDGNRWIRRLVRREEERTLRRSHSIATSSPQETLFRPALRRSITVLSGPWAV